MKLTKILLLCIMPFSTLVFAKDVSFSSGVYQNTVLELYTSEGCSSCPPAEKWFNSLTEHQQLFGKIVPLVFHVDYWDYIGWKDRFAKPEYAKRQRRHKREGNLSQVYTPGVLKNGKEYRIWSYNKRHLYALGKNVGKLQVDVVDDIVYVNFNNQQKTNHLIANVALLGFGFVSKITSGENRAKTLKHNFVVLDHKHKLSRVNRWSIKLPRSNKTAKRYALAVWITEKNSLKPIQASANWL